MKYTIWLRVWYKIMDNILITESYGCNNDAMTVDEEKFCLKKKMLEPLGNNSLVHKM